jgi:hypothetical protein
MIAKAFSAYGTNYLRQEISLRDHEGLESRRTRLVAGLRLFSRNSVAAAPAPEAEGQPGQLAEVAGVPE